MLDYSNIRLTEDILQACYKSKTYVRNEQWDILWYLGGKNDVTIGQKDDKFYFIPKDNVEIVTEILPFELVHCQHITGSTIPMFLKTVGDLVKYCGDQKSIINKINMHIISN